MLGRRRVDPVREVLADFAPASQIKQARVRRVLGAAPSWHVDPAAGVVTVGGARFRLDVLGTESGGRFRWAWADPAFTAEQTLTAHLVRRVGRDWDVEALAADGGLPLARVDAEVAAAIGAGIGSADGAFVGRDGARAIAVLLRGRVLRDAPLVMADVVAGLKGCDDLPTALEALETEPPPGLLVRHRGDHTEIHVADGHVTATRGSDLVCEQVSDLAGVHGPDSGGERGSDPAGEGRSPHSAGAVRMQDLTPVRKQDLAPLGVLGLSEGAVVVFDPLLAADPMFAVPRPGTLPGAAHAVVVEVDADGADERVAGAQLVVGPGAPVAWQPVGSVLVDSGVCAFAAPDAAARLVAGGEAALEALADALAASARPTWQHAALDGVVAFSSGHGAGEYELAWGFDADDRLVRVAVSFLPEAPLSAPDEEERSPAEEPGPGLERALMLPLAAGGALEPENALVLPPGAHRALTALHRRMIRATLAGHDLEAEVLPEYDGDAPVPVRLDVRADAGDASFAAVVEVGAP